MGLCATAKGLTDETGFDCGYLTFGHFRIELAKAYNAELGLIYEKHYKDQELSESEISRYDELCNPDLDIFLFHDDGEGTFSPSECRRIYSMIEDMKMDMVGHNYGVMKNYNMLEHWKNIFKHCAKNRVTLYFK